MGEMSDLEKSAREAYTAQRMDALIDYVENQFAELDLVYASRKKWGAMMMCIWFTWIYASASYAFFGGAALDLIHQIAMWFYFVIALGEWFFVLPRYFSVQDELRGCIRTLEILGMLKERDDGNRRLKKYRESFMAKMWAALKSEKMRKAFA